MVICAPHMLLGTHQTVCSTILEDIARKRTGLKFIKITLVYTTLHFREYWCIWNCSVLVLFSPWILENDPGMQEEQTVSNALVTPAVPDSVQNHSSSVKKFKLSSGCSIMTDLTNWSVRSRPTLCGIARYRACHEQICSDCVLNIHLKLQMRSCVWITEMENKYNRFGERYYMRLTPSELEYDPDPQKEQEVDAPVPQQCRQGVIQGNLATDYKEKKRTLFNYCMIMPGCTTSQRAITSTSFSKKHDCRIPYDANCPFGHTVQKEAPAFRTLF